ncbi:hypothetical protein BX616_007523 [Lobosporangium transversale]|uniref:FAD-binding domain-containing protein n=1 Tax=Lobosporangium transversale TaxID=64571 RepID=A0A1Y2H396_9FUNG|nr:hypothetical protein BCR41DRAFT_418111 [Lobosporangium transversale]KAF9914805.1 hypothetical protein BX616_007523 [Lobosporangium transversale]ORZ29030.1 hypothetical protein BCR41DRAFT_418111 [Lobosporangium transversale]|eukprot:XP_021886703.1 hypothetical protein BCR41DRAFT_418111 [Lobosporangium transversale]
MDNTEPTPPRVLIVGAGLGGLMLGLLLEKIGIPYDIFERAPILKPYGAAMGLVPNIMPVFEQLGLLEEILKVSFPAVTMDIYREDLRIIGSLDIGGSSELIGYDSIVFSRPDLHRLLVSKTPPGRIHLGKRVLSVGQSEHGALIRCADGSVHQGDIVVGADGAYSAVRQNLYDRLEKEGKLPRKDTESLSLGYTCLVGTSQPMDPEKYPVLKDPFSHFGVVIADGKPHSSTILTVPGNRICFGIVIQLTPEEKEAVFRNSEWGPESLDNTIAKIQDHPIPFGGTIHDIIRATPKDVITNVYLEEKIFETWTYKRIALLGDACHKMLPSAGQGAVNALYDAVALANCIYEMNDNSQSQIEAALKDYKRQRYPLAKMQVEGSAMAGKLLYGQTWIEKFGRKMVFSWMPNWLEKTTLTRAAAYQPQAVFLPFTKKRGRLNIKPPKPSKKYLEEQRRKGAAEGIETEMNEVNDRRAASEDLDTHTI